jgi:hypothetical protein
MIEQFQHKAVTSFMLWFDNFLLKKGQAFSNKTAVFTHYNDDRLDDRYKAFGSPYKQWVNDSSIVGADIPSGVYINNQFSGRGSNLMLDFQNGRALISGVSSSATISGSFALKDFNIYFTNDDEVITAAKYYHRGSNTLNDFLRSGGQISWSKEDLEDMIKKTPDPKNMIPMKYMMYTVLTLDNHFKTSGAILQNDTVVYRGVQDKVLQKFVESGEWVDNGFVSTSLNPIIAEDFYSKNYQARGMAPIFEIKLKRGSKVLMLPCSEDEYCIESEITLPRGCSFKIEEHDKEKNVYKVSVEMPNA